MPPKRGQSAYFVFCGENRARVREECEKASEDGKASVTVVAKRLGEAWQGLPAEEKERYQQIAAEKNAAEAARQEQEEEGEAQGERDEKQNEEEAYKGESPHPFGFPVSLIKRIMTMDDEVGSAAAGAVRATAKATELVIQLLVAKAYKVAAENKRKTIKFGDVEKVLMTDKRWEHSGMREMLLEDPIFEEARAEAAPGGRPKKRVEEDPKARMITGFYRGAQ